MFERNCPECNKTLSHKTEEGRNRARRENKKCRNCSLTEAQNRPDVKERLAAYRREHFKGEGNPFYGKTHSAATKAKIVLSRDPAIWQTDSFRKKISDLKIGDKNPMAGKSVYYIWVASYGKDDANKKWAEMQKSKSIKQSGEGNPMFGKPAPEGSGGGWSGWYNGWYFRSLRELSYMVEVIEPFGHVWRTAESKELSIPYVDQNGANRTYRADFLLDSNILVEIKPVRLMNTPSNQLKLLAAMKFCEARGWEYRIVDAVLIDVSKLKSLCAKGDVKLIAKWQERLDKWKL